MFITNSKWLSTLTRTPPGAKHYRQFYLALELPIGKYPMLRCWTSFWRDITKSWEVLCTTGSRFTRRTDMRCSPVYVHAESVSNVNPSAATKDVRTEQTLSLFTCIYPYWFRVKPLQRPYKVPFRVISRNDKTFMDILNYAASVIQRYSRRLNGHLQGSVAGCHSTKWPAWPRYSTSTNPQVSGKSKH